MRARRRWTVSDHSERERHLLDDLRRDDAHAPRAVAGHAPPAARVAADDRLTAVAAEAVRPERGQAEAEAAEVRVARGVGDRQQLAQRDARAGGELLRVLARLRDGGGQRLVLGRLDRRADRVVAVAVGGVGLAEPEPTATIVRCATGSWAEAAAGSAAPSSAPAASVAPRRGMDGDTSLPSLVV